MIGGLPTDNEAAPMMTAAILIIFPLCLAIAAFSDLLTMTIPNRVSVVLIVAFLAIAPFAGLGLEAIGWHLAAGLAVFSACFALFALNIMGGGDAKVLTASAIWFGLNASLMTYLTWVAIFGGVLSLAVLLLRSQSGLMAISGIRIPKTLQHARKVPYGIAIGFAGFVAYPESPLMQLILPSIQ